MISLITNIRHKYRVRFQKEIRTHFLFYILLSLILLLAFIVRIYRLDQLLGFYYDQARDALVIWKLWHEGKFFLIGPVTGLAGIFLGPFYYYLIAPFYLIGRGNPVFPALFLAFLATGSIGIVYYLGWKMQSKATGIIALLICSFSYYLVLAGRWLANPTPILFTSMILLLSMWKISQSTKKVSQSWWLIIALTIGVSLQFESSSAVFYIPMITVFTIWVYFTNKRNRPDKKVFFFSGLLFFITLLPQLLFNMRHDNLLFNNFYRIFFQEKSFRSPFGENLAVKKKLFWAIFTSKIFPSLTNMDSIFYMGSLVGLVLLLTKKNKALTLIAIYLGVPVLGYIFYQGNNGNLYDYYLTGYYYPMILLFSLGLGAIWKHIVGKVLVIWFLIIFLNMNGLLIYNNIRAGVDGPTHITLGNELQSVDWVFDNAKNLKEFNIDIYVPPVIPYTYDYLFTWQGTDKCGINLCGLVRDKEVSTLYTLYEQDPPHPERLEDWLNRQKGVGRVVEESSYGGITVQKRERLP